uniref:type VI secretion system baseplate subunit TssF n=1 Tax=Klebsiella michiganensis TaxID=1134687 RepID=UPI001D17FDF9
SASVAVRNLCAPTLPCYPPAQDRFHWRVLSHLGSGFLSMMDNGDLSIFSASWRKTRRKSSVRIPSDRLLYRLVSKLRIKGIND